MSLPEYKNLTADELEMADHYAEIGDMNTLRAFQRLSASRGSEELNPDTYLEPMKPAPTEQGR